MRFLKIEKDLVDLKLLIQQFMSITKINEHLDSITDEHVAYRHLPGAEGMRANETLVEIIQTKLSDAGVINYFHSEINKLKRYLRNYLQRIEDSPYVNEEELNAEFVEFVDALYSIINKIDLLFHVESLSKTNQDEHNYIYAVKLPQYEYFDDVADFTKQLNFIFSVVMKDNKKVKLVGFDKGSEWYQVALDNLIDFKIMALFISEVTKWVKYVVEDKLRANQLDIDEDARKLIIENMQTNQMMIRDSAMKKVLGESGATGDPEEHSRYQMAFERMANLMMKGTEVEVDKQDYSDEPLGEEVTPLELSRLDIQGLLELGSDLLIEHNPSSEDE